MAPALDIGFTIDAFAVTDGDIDDFRVDFGSPEDQVEIAEGIEIAEVGALPAICA